MCARRYKGVPARVSGANQTAPLMEGRLKNKEAPMMKKKIVSLVLAFMLCLSCVSALAAEA